MSYLKVLLSTSASLCLLMSPVLAAGKEKRPDIDRTMVQRSPPHRVSSGPTSGPTGHSAAAAAAISEAVTIAALPSTVNSPVKGSREGFAHTAYGSPQLDTGTVYVVDAASSTIRVYQSGPLSISSSPMNTSSEEGVCVYSAPTLFNFLMLPSVKLKTRLSGELNYLIAEYAEDFVESERSYCSFHAHLTLPETVALTGFHGFEQNRLNHLVAQYVSSEESDEDVIGNQVQQARTMRRILLSGDEQTQAYMHNTVVGDVSLEQMDLFSRKKIALLDSLFSECFWNFSSTVLDSTPTSLSYEGQVVLMRNILRYAALQFNDFSVRIAHRTDGYLMNQLVASRANPALDTTTDEDVLHRFVNSRSGVSPSTKSVVKAALNMQHQYLVSGLGGRPSCEDITTRNLFLSNLSRLPGFAPIASSVYKSPHYHQIRKQATQHILATTPEGRLKQDLQLVYRVRTYGRNIRGFANDTQLHRDLTELFPAYSLPRQYLDTSLAALNLFFNLSSRFHFPESVVNSLISTENGVTAEFAGEADCVILNPLQGSLNTTILSLNGSNWHRFNNQMWDGWVRNKVATLTHPFSIRISNLSQRWQAQATNLRLAVERVIPHPSSLMTLPGPTQMGITLGGAGGVGFSTVRTIPATAMPPAHVGDTSTTFSTVRAVPTRVTPVSPNTTTSLVRVTRPLSSSTSVSVPRQVLTLRDRLDRQAALFLQRLTIDHELARENLTEGAVKQLRATPFDMADLEHYLTQMGISIVPTHRGIKFRLPNYDINNPLVPTYAFVHPPRGETSLCPGRISTLINDHTVRKITLDSPANE